MDPKLDKRGTPDVKKAKSFREIVGNFTDPKELVREAVSNALDWKATVVRITVEEDLSRADRELVVLFEDNGIGLNRVRFKAFWNLADSPQPPEYWNRVGEKGYGTKTYWKSRQIEVESIASESGGMWHVLAQMNEPINTLNQDRLPDYDYAEELLNSGEQTYTKITIRGYHAQSREDFRHEVLLDYIRWFTKFGSIELELDHEDHKGKVLWLKGLGRSEHEKVEFGHPFPKMSDNIPKLRSKEQDDWPQHYVRKWVFPKESIPGYPSSTFDLVFYLEGDAAKRLYNRMIRRRGRSAERWHYTVTDRYGLYPCRDWIPLPSSQRFNHWVSEKTEWTLFHAFVNCQDFGLTANRASIGNTDNAFISALREAVETLFRDRIKKSEAYRAYEEAIEETKKQGTAESTADEERQDLQKRQFHAKKKRIAQFKPKQIGPIVLREPREEVEVLMMFTIVSNLQPKLFNFAIVDYSARKGIDALCTLDPLNAGLEKGDLRFVEFKKALTRDIGNHTFKSLAGIVCWECNMEAGSKVRDLAGDERELKISHSGGQTTYMLLAPPELAAPNIRVYVLREYLREKLGLEFTPQRA